MRTRLPQLSTRYREVAPPGEGHSQSRWYPHELPWRVASDSMASEPASPSTPITVVGDFIATYGVVIDRCSASSGGGQANVRNHRHPVSERSA